MRRATPFLVLGALAWSMALAQGPKPAPVPVESCPLHKAKLKNGWAIISYGLIPPFQTLTDYAEARRNSFPNANSKVSGGCVVQAKKTQKVKFCSTCRDVEANWLKSRRKH